MTMIALWAAACGLVLFCSSRSGVEGIGVNYGLIGDNLPSPDKVVSLYIAHNITDVRLFHPDTAVLDALRGSGLGVVLGTLNSDLAPLASDASYAASWVASYVAPYASSVRFRYINAGNEVVPGEGSEHILEAIKNLESALSAAGLGNGDGPVRVTTAVATSVLGASFPPSHGAFSDAAMPVMAPLVSYLAERGSPLLVNAYPYFAYAADPASVPLDYALLSPSAAPAVTDDDGVQYVNMFDAIVDAVHAAVEKVTGSGQGVELVVSETGWPSGGGGYGASVENAAAYMNNLVRHVGSGTPRRPGKAVETYIFAMFNENQKPEGVERYFGLFQPDMTEVYHVDF
ncbi:putative glucan endo-1,3-beta-glucosidase GVI [Brachypodium distachyon]|nr:putative glucan endo-1,3-beta-glucosidase GVI [Brachypodium distachyon]|eukprot:XP_003564413.2 putative glucan endo-1,3-beta-glucosidase GVI [Brachypodium distachyon]